MLQWQLGCPLLTARRDQFRWGCGRCEVLGLVRNAHAAGLTEPDTRIDLSGVDVAAKICIISRLCGVETGAERDDSFLNTDFPEGSVAVDGFVNSVDQPGDRNVLRGFSARSWTDWTRKCRRGLACLMRTGLEPS